MASKPRSVVTSVEESTYRCPGCGKLVDKQSISQVLEHHQHVLHASGRSAWFDRQPNAETTQVSANKTAQAIDRRSDTNAVSPEVLLRRYGH